MAPLPVPERGGCIDELRQFLNVEIEGDFKLITAWMLAALRSRGPYAILALIGEGGSAKTTAVRVLRDLVDPQFTDVKRPPKDERDLFIDASQSSIIAFDNLTGITQSFSDSLCTLATGATLTTRALHTDDERINLSACLPVVMTSVGEVISASDLASRALVVPLATIPEDKRRAEDEFMASFNTAKPKMLGVLLDAMSRGIGRLPLVKLKGMPRMADFAKWAQACEGKFWLEGSTYDAFEANRDAARAGIVYSDPVNVALISFMEMQEGGFWKGTGTALLSALSGHALPQVTREKYCPKDPTRLGNVLTKNGGDLRKIGLAIVRTRSKLERTFEITLKAGDADP
jgi:hypothetical protein